MSSLLAKNLDTSPRATYHSIACQAAAGGRRENRPSRKVRTPQGRVVGKADPGKPAGKCHRKETAQAAGSRRRQALGPVWRTRAPVRLRRRQG